MIPSQFLQSTDQTYMPTPTHAFYNHMLLVGLGGCAARAVNKTSLSYSTNPTTEATSSSGGSR